VRGTPPWRCVHGIGLDRCGQPRTQIAGSDHPELCFFHAKLAAGLMACSADGCSRYAGHKPPCSPVRETRLTMTPDTVLNDELIELSALLRREGA
jgi:hypothetical protein